jgi:hypothetical protein
MQIAQDYQCSPTQDICSHAQQALRISKQDYIDLQMQPNGNIDKLENNTTLKKIRTKSRFENKCN